MLDIQSLDSPLQMALARAGEAAAREHYKRIREDPDVPFPADLWNSAEALCNPAEFYSQSMREHQRQQARLSLAKYFYQNMGYLWLTHQEKVDQLARMLDDYTNMRYWEDLRISESTFDIAFRLIREVPLDYHRWHARGTLDRSVVLTCEHFLHVVVNRIGYIRVSCSWQDPSLGTKDEAAAIAFLKEHFFTPEGEYKGPWLGL